MQLIHTLSTVDSILNLRLSACIENPLPTAVLQFSKMTMTSFAYSINVKMMIKGTYSEERNLWHFEQPRQRQALPKLNSETPWLL